MKDADVNGLDLDAALVHRARELAHRAGQPVVELARSHTTVSVERATLRLAGPLRQLPGAPYQYRIEVKFRQE